jgi:hypothetical protein
MAAEMLILTGLAEIDLANPRENTSVNKKVVRKTSDRLFCRQKFLLMAILSKYVD